MERKREKSRQWKAKIVAEGKNDNLFPFVEREETMTQWMRGLWGTATEFSINYDHFDWYHAGADPTFEDDWA